MTASHHRAVAIFRHHRSGALMRSTSILQSVVRPRGLRERGTNSVSGLLRWRRHGSVAGICKNANEESRAGQRTWFYHRFKCTEVLTTFELQNKRMVKQKNKKNKPNGDTKKIQSLIRTSVPLMSCFTRTWYFCHPGRLKGRPFLSCYFLPRVCIYTCLPPGASYINRYVFFFYSTIFQRVS